MTPNGQQHSLLFVPWLEATPQRGLISAEHSCLRMLLCKLRKVAPADGCMGSATSVMATWLLTRACLRCCRRHPHSVVLLDEVEKAHQDVVSAVDNAIFRKSRRCEALLDQS